MPFDPSTIIDKQFITSFRGYNTTEVDEFLEELLQEFIALDDELQRARQEIAALQEQNAMFQVMEETMKTSLSSTQQTADKVLENAHREAELIIRRAQLQADKEVSLALRESERQLAANKREAEGVIARAQKEAEIAVAQAEQAKTRIAEYGARVRIALEAQMAILSGDKLFQVSPYALPSGMPQQETAAAQPQEPPSAAQMRTSVLAGDERDLLMEEEEDFLLE
ncbi:MAG: DivIVA domain-containing protein [Christensenellales bacterium]|jgi:DivIVA domain-containing protein